MHVHTPTEVILRVVCVSSSLDAPLSFGSNLSLAIFQAFARQIENFLGDDTIEPALQFPPGPPPPGFDAPPLEFASWSEISEVCGDSRAWGGMHFAVRMFFLWVIA